ncbi:MAG: Rid family detoxifying hydrolase [Lachnospirales bacterium]
MSQIVYTPDAPAAIGPYSQAVVCNGLIFTSGQIAINPLSQKVEATTIEEQTKQVLTNLTAVLEAAGSSMEKVVKTTCFLANMEDFTAFNAIYAQYFPGRPARSCVAVKTLPNQVLVEVEAIAEQE